MASSKFPNVWGKTETPQTVTPCPLEAIINGQLHHEIQQQNQGQADKISSSKETQAADVSATAMTEKLSDADIVEILGSATRCVEDGDTRFDEMIARMMQEQSDREYNKMVLHQQNRINGIANVGISFEKYMNKTPLQPYQEVKERSLPYYPPTPRLNSDVTQPPAWRGVNLPAKRMKSVAKKYREMASSEVMEELKKFYGTNNEDELYNDLEHKVSNMMMSMMASKDHEETKSTSEEKDRSTNELVFDKDTRLKLFKLVNNGLLESIGGVIATGKESAVYQSRLGSMTKDLNLPEDASKDVAVKIYKTSKMEFKRRQKYVQGVHGLTKNKKKDPRTFIKQWAKKELSNLMRMRSFGLPCPSVVTLNENVLIMSMIGDENGPADKLRHCSLSYEDLQDAYDQTVQIMKTLHEKCGLVHADLSEYNLLWHNKTVYVIDVSQSVEINHPEALNFLLRDCTNICNFFGKQGVHDVPSPEMLFKEVTGMDYPRDGAETEVLVRKCDKHRKEKQTLLDEENSEFDFEYHYKNKMDEKDTDKEYSDDEEESSSEEKDENEQQ